MPIHTLIKKSEYHDSVSLMLVARDLAETPGIRDAAVVMATEANKSILAEAGLLDDQANTATSNDLVIAVSAEDAVLAEGALQKAEKLLVKKTVTRQVGPFQPKTIRSAVSASPEANVAVISVAGRYAADEAWDALRMGLHVLLFSDNVSLADEIALKKYAVEHGLLLMGPGAGTAILNGVALGFANAVPAGPVGIVSAAGTGLQEVSTILARHAIGVTQGIGTGGRDLKEEVGGLMMLAGLQALQDDPATTVILLVSKPPAMAVAEKVLGQAARGDKPTVVCFLGGDFSRTLYVRDLQLAGHVQFSRTLQGAALLAARLAGAALPELSELLATENRIIQDQAAALCPLLKPSQSYLRGLFSGGTLCYEAQVIWRDLLAEPVRSNAPLDEGHRLPDSTRSQAHSAVDLGEEEFTVGRPHPMIDNDLRIRRMLQEARDPEVAVILLDVVLGFGAHPDPASELAPAIRKAKALAAGEARALIFVASVTGTEADPQKLSRQVQTLQDAGVVVCSSNANAARLTAELVKK